MPLQTANQYNLVADAAPLADRISGIVDQRRAEQKEAEALKREMLRQNLKTTGAQFLRIRDMPDINSKKKAIADLASAAFKRGEDIDVYDQAMLQDNVDDLNAYLIQVATRADQALKKDKKESLTPDFVDGAGGIDYGKLNYGDYTPESLAKFIKAGGGRENIGILERYAAPQIVDVGGVPYKVSRSGSGEPTLVPLSTLDKEKEGLSEIAGAKSGAAETAKLDAQAGIGGGTSSADIATEVATAEAEVASKTEPQLAADIKQANAAVEKADKLFESVDKINLNISNLREARQAVLDGAGTGPIERLWPSFREASVRLDNQRGRMALDVVGATTFGALSKGELDLSKDIALPDGLDGPELVKWIDKRIAAQEAKNDYFTRQAIFLSEKNDKGKQNTKADWAKAEKAALQRALDANDVTEADIKETMRANNMTRSAVLREIRRRFESGGT